MKFPATWIETTVRSVVEDLQPGFAQKPGEEDEGTTPQIRTHNVTPDGKISLEGIKHITASEKELERYSLALGDVVFNNTNSEEWVGKTAVFDQEGDYVFSNHMTRLRAQRDLVNPEYLAGYLHLLWSMGYSKTRAKRWVSQAGIESNTLASFKLPLPTIPEQQRIVDVLRQAESVNQLASDARALSDALAKERFAEMFGHPAENPKGFETAPFQSFGALDRGMSKHRPRDAAHLFGGPYPFIQTGDVSNAGDWITSYKSTYSDAGLAQSRLWPKGTLCITIAANIAKAAILEFDACFPDSVVGFTPNSGISSEYVLYCLRFYQEYFEHRAPKSAQMNINLNMLRTLRMPKPSEAMQLEFADFVREMRAFNKVASDQADRRSELLKELTVSAFIGELTADWREQHQDEIIAAAREREDALGSAASKFKVQITEHAPPERSTGFPRPRRQALINQLSSFQHEVWNMLRNEWRGAVLVDDPAVFEDFCANPQTAWRLDGFDTAPINVRRALEQLAAMGLVRKFSLAKLDPANEVSHYLTAFRPLREDKDGGRAEEDVALDDAASVSAELARREKGGV
jgi:type I restriction enzyme S subunit